MKNKKIYCLNTILEHNDGYEIEELESWFSNKPTIKNLMDYFEIDDEDLLVIYDDLDLPVGKLRLRQKGSAGGHNGIKSTIAHLGSQQFNRLRVGIDRPTNGMSVPDYVLGKFSKEEQPELDKAITSSVEACETWLDKPFLEVMNKFN